MTSSNLAGSTSFSTNATNRKDCGNPLEHLTPPVLPLSTLGATPPLRGPRPLTYYDRHWRVKWISLSPDGRLIAMIMGKGKYAARREMTWKEYFDSSRGIYKSAFVAPSSDLICIFDADYGGVVAEYALPLNLVTNPTIGVAVDELGQCRDDTGDDNRISDTAVTVPGGDPGRSGEIGASVRAPVANRSRSLTGEHQPSWQVYPHCAAGYYCQFLNHSDLLVSWVANVRHPYSEHYVFFLSIDIGTWTHLDGPCERPLLNFLSRTPAVHYSTPHLHTVMQASPWDLARVQIRRLDLDGGSPIISQIVHLSATEFVMEHVQQLHIGAWQDRLYLMVVFDRIYVYDYGDHHLETVDSLPDPRFGYPMNVDPKIRHHYGFAVHGPHLYVSGGYSLAFSRSYNERERPHQDMWRLSLSLSQPELQWHRSDMVRLPPGLVFNCLSFMGTEAPDGQQTTVIFGACQRFEKQDPVKFSKKSTVVSDALALSLTTKRNANNVFRLCLGVQSLEDLCWKRLIQAFPGLITTPQAAVMASGIFPVNVRSRLLDIDDFPLIGSAMNTENGRGQLKKSGRKKRWFRKIKAVTDELPRPPKPPKAVRTVARTVWEVLKGPEEKGIF